MKPSISVCTQVFALACVALLVPTVVQGSPVPQVDLVGVEQDTGRLFSISTADASLTLIGYTGVDNLGALEMSPDGILYGITTDAQLYSIDPTTALATKVLDLDTGRLTGYEGSLAFGSDGTAYATNFGPVTYPRLLSLDLTTGAGTQIGFFDNMSSVRRDVNGLGWRDDGVLVGLDRYTNSLVEIDPTTGVISSTITTYTEPVFGGIGGMALGSDYGFFATGGPISDANAPGSNELYSFDPYTGVATKIGNFNSTIFSDGFAGLAVVPEPATLMLLGLGGLSLLRRRR